MNTIRQNTCIDGHIWTAYTMFLQNTTSMIFCEWMIGIVLQYVKKKKKHTSWKRTNNGKIWTEPNSPSHMACDQTNPLQYQHKDSSLYSNTVWFFYNPSMDIHVYTCTMPKKILCVHTHTHPYILMSNIFANNRLIISIYLYIYMCKYMCIYLYNDY